MTCLGFVAEPAVSGAWQARIGCQSRVNDVWRRMEGRLPRLVTTDEYPSYAVAIHRTCGHFPVLPAISGFRSMPGTRNGVWQCWHFTSFPRTSSGTERNLRQRRFGQI